MSKLKKTTCLGEKNGKLLQALVVDGRAHLEDGQGGLEVAELLPELILVRVGVPLDQVLKLGQVVGQLVVLALGADDLGVVTGLVVVLALAALAGALHATAGGCGRCHGFRALFHFSKTTRAGFVLTVIRRNPSPSSQPLMHRLRLNLARWFSK